MFIVAYFSESPRDPRRFASLAAARRAFKADAEDYFASTRADLYLCDSEEHWAEARRFEGVGCPFDGIDVRLTVGPRGGILTERG